MIVELGNSNIPLSIFYSGAHINHNKKVLSRIRDKFSTKHISFGFTDYHLNLTTTFDKMYNQWNNVINQM